VKNPQLLVIGGGPAGLGAAIEARRCGVDVLMVDEQSRPGGQLFKQIHKFFGSREHQAGIRGYEIGAGLLEDAEKSGVRTLLSTRVLGIFPDRRVSLLLPGNRVETVHPEAVVIATGGGEKGVAFPGWTLPGVITAGAAQTFCNIHRVLPGERIVVLGSGNVGLIVAFQLLQAGAEVLSVLEAKEYQGGYQVHGDKILRAGVPIRTGFTVKEVRGDKWVEEIVITAVDSSCTPLEGTGELISADTLCIAAGLYSGGRIAAMAGCEMFYSPEFLDSIPRHDRMMETSVPGIFIAGDASGVEEANTALEEGRIAGTAAAWRLGLISRETLEAETFPVWERLNKLRSGSFGVLRSIGKQRIMASGEVFEAPVYPGFCEDTFSPDLEPPVEGKGDRPVAVIHCYQDIPCDPCVDVCPVHAISMKPAITGLPKVDKEVCTGCGLCLAICPGQAIFLYQDRYDDLCSSLTFVYEFLPLPAEGESCEAVDRRGAYVCDAKIVKVRTGSHLHASPLVTIAFDRQYRDRVRSLKLRKREKSV
jgi:thioredoxin reductase/Fe-S-cluster-containing hydrogenase component 2